MHYAIIHCLYSCRLLCHKEKDILAKTHQSTLSTSPTLFSALVTRGSSMSLKSHSRVSTWSSSSGRCIRWVRQWMIRQMSGGTLNFCPNILRTSCTDVCRTHLWCTHRTWSATHRECSTLLRVSLKEKENDITCDASLKIWEARLPWPNYHFVGVVDFFVGLLPVDALQNIKTWHSFPSRQGAPLTFLKGFLGKDVGLNKKRPSLQCVNGHNNKNREENTW